VAGVAALVAGAVARLAGPDRVQAGHTSLNNPEPLHIGQVNNGGNPAGESDSNITTATFLLAKAFAETLRVGTIFPGSRGMWVFGGNNTNGDAGYGCVAVGGSSDSRRGGLGVEVRGGASNSFFAGGGLSARAGDSNSGTGGTGVEGVGGNGAVPGPGVFGIGGLTFRAGNGLPESGADGVVGVTSSAAKAGVFGRNVWTGTGVRGWSGETGAGNGTGVHGQCAGGEGVRGEATTGYGVHGSASSSAPSAVGVLGTGYLGVFGDAAQFGVYGYASGASGQGLHAEAPAGLGCVTVGQQGLYAEGTGSLGLEARCVSGIALQAYSATSLAGRFVGPVLVEGSFTATGVKSAAVPHPDGSHRRMYCIEAPESVFEDFGDDRVVNGRATVRLDRDFAAVVRGDHYRVFLTPEGDCNGLYVSGKGPTSFEVRELKGGTSTLAFSYRVVAKRRDVEGPRLERVPMPAPPVRPRIEGIERPQERGRPRR
jgi:hypothetical protein